MSTIKIVVEFGADAIPGVGEVLDAGLEAAGYAAALIDYYYNVDQKPEEAFDFWLAPCGGSAFVPQEIKDVFDVLSGLDPGRWGFKGGNIPKGKGQKGDKGNPDRKDRDNDQKDVTITQLQADAKTTQVALVTKTEKCDAGKDPQGTLHLYSVLSTSRRDLLTG
ncbi:hypothetical protein K491DRAFT_271028 [Lophiostoma macrostomum CBS 122681]|uniref:Uncharacterized protein n=1 Tax=Lophiostoma macrostomum CBS 122681 TaxID=1314788 RepID=A0A6A6SNN8_9PLEO|nr:hypothetical protein K491DRAFT_271028 [Lophiostoma macrostomum CBS 122681]